MQDMTNQLRWLGIVAMAALGGPSPAQMPPDMLRTIPLITVLDADADGLLSADEIERAPAALPSLDADGNGVLTADELLPSGAGPEGGRAEGLLRRLPVMTALDGDGNGEISAAEIGSATTALVTLDADGSGTLATGELAPGPGGRARGGPGRGQGPPLASLPVMVAIDRDGNGEISAEELSDASRALRSLDADENGTLRQDELVPDGNRFPSPRGRPAEGDTGRPVRGPGGGPGGMLAMFPLVRSLDVDRSGEIEATEIDSAPESLASLDADGDGNLSGNELMPPFGRGGGGAFGRGGGRGGFRGGGGFGGEPPAELKQPDELAREDGAATIPDRETFDELSYEGDQVMRDTNLRGVQFVKFIISEVGTDAPKIYFQNTKKYRAHPQFMRAVGVIGGGGPGGGGLLRGAIVYRPLLTSPSGQPGLYTFEFQPRDSFPFETIRLSMELLEAHSALMAGNLAYHARPGAVARYEQEREQYENAGLPVFTEDELFSDIAYLPLNLAEGFGRLRLMSLDERPGPRDIVLYKSLPNEMPRVAGIITAVRQTPLSHVNLRAVQDAVPNAYIRGAAEDARIAGLIGKYVRYKVEAGGYEIREAAIAEVERHFRDLRPSEPQAPARDLSVRNIRPLSEIGFEDSANVGVKAANVATLGTLGFPSGTVPEGFAVPFHFYDEFMRFNNLYTEVSAMLEEPRFSTDTDERESRLKDFRRRVREGAMPDWMAAALSELQGRFPETQPIRLRSSTNNEDLPGFSGAGLYDSYTHHPDEGHIAKSVKQVYASLWNFRAFEEREFYRIDHLAAAMGVLVHPNYSDERANGVAVSEDIVYQTGGAGRPLNYYVNTQVGEDLVTNPEGESIPEEVLLASSGPAGDQHIRSSNRAPEGEALLSVAHRNELRSYLQTIHNRFGELYGVSPNERFAMEIEFKVTAEGQLAVKQARPWVFN